MVDPFPGVPYSVGALRKTFGPLWVRGDVCRLTSLVFSASVAQMKKQDATELDLYSGGSGHRFDSFFGCSGRDGSLSQHHHSADAASAALGA
jgi:hypothetical protein